MIVKLAPFMMLATGGVAESMPSSLPDPNHFASVGWVVVSLAGVMIILKAGLDLWKDHFREDPRPAGTYVTLSACEAHRAKSDKRIDDCRSEHASGDEALENDIHSLGRKIDQATAAMQTEASRRASTVHQRMDSMDRKLAKVEERSEATQAELRLLNQNLMSYLREARK